MVDDLDELIRAQRGAVSARQLLAYGVARSTANRRVARGEWQRAFRGAYVVEPNADAWRAAAALAARGYVSHASAARWWRLDGAPEEPRPTVSVAHSRHPRAVDGAQVRRTRCPEPGVLVASPARTLLDLAPHVHPARLQVLTGDAVRRGLADEQALRAAADLLGQRRALRAVLDALDIVDPLAESALEQRFLNLLRCAGLPMPAPQYLVEDGLGWFCHLDVAWPDLRVGGQVDGERWHGDHRAFVADRALDRRLAALGWVVVRVTAHDVYRRPRQLVADVAAVLAAATARSA